MDMGIRLWVPPINSASPRSFERAYSELVEDARLAKSGLHSCGYPSITAITTGIVRR